MVRIISLPENITSKLAELLGIIVGDGYVRTRTPFCIFIETSSEEKDYIDNHVIPFFEEVFKIKLQGRFFNRNGIKNTYGFYVCNKNLVNFLADLGVGINHNFIRVPKIILENKIFWKEFLRGYFDTDGYINFFSHNKWIYSYPRIGVSTTSKLLANDIIKMLNGLKFKFSYWVAPARGRTKHKVHRIEFKGFNNLEKWFNEIGFRNIVKINKYLIWKKFGFCPPNLNLETATKILNHELDPYKFIRHP